MEKKKNLNRLYIVVPAVIVLIIVAFLAGPVYSGYFSDKTMRNLKIRNISVGNNTVEQVKDILIKDSEGAKTAKIDWQGNEFEINLAEAGLALDADKTAEAAMNAGRESFWKVISSWYGGNTVDFQFAISEEQFEESVTALMSELGILKGSYSVEVQTNNAVFTVNEDAGEPDTEALLRELTEKFPDFSEPFRLSQKEFVWPTAEQIRADFDSEATDAYVSNENGERRIVGHKEGRQIDFEALSKAIESKEKTFTVPYKVLKPKVYTDQLGDENFPVLLGKCVTRYNEGAVNRSANVKLAASKINGYVMNKGDVFSFNGVVGKRTHAAGFRDAPVYTGTGVEDGVGGGICQVSSTLYGAVLEANLKIVSRLNHSYVVSYTKPGLDATVSYGSIDFRFSNPFEQPIKIKAVASGGNMTVYIYGTKQNNNTVSLEYKILGTTPRPVKRVFNPALKVGSEVVTTAGYDGMKVQNYRHIKDASGNIIKTENLGISNYITLNKVIEYNDGASVTPDIPKEELQTPETPVVLPQLPETTAPSAEEPDESVLPENPTQENPELDPEYSGNAEVEIPVSEDNKTIEENDRKEVDEVESDI